MTEIETRDELIDFALQPTGRGVLGVSRFITSITIGLLQGGPASAQAQEIADYVLTFRNHKLAVIEAKAEDKGPSRRRRAGQGLRRRSCRRALPSPPTAGASTGSTWRPGAEGYVDALSDAGRNSGPRCSRRRTNGATASPPFRSRTRGGTWQDALLPAQRHRERAGGDRQRLSSASC